MVPGTLALARQVMEALGRRDLAAVIAVADGEVELHSFFAQLGGGGVYRGHDGTRQYVSDLTDAWDLVRADVDDGDRDPGRWMLTRRQGKVVRFRAFREPERALEAVGLVA
jgi:hypothetical protein